MDTNKMNEFNFRLRILYGLVYEMSERQTFKCHKTLIPKCNWNIIICIDDKNHPQQQHHQQQQHIHAILCIPPKRAILITVATTITVRTNNKRKQFKQLARIISTIHQCD